MRHKLTLTFSVAVFVLSTISCSAQKLNPYTGSLKELLPNQVGEYKLQDTRNPPSDPGNHLHVTFRFADGIIAIYKRPDTNEGIELLVLNYPSADNARDGWSRQKEYLLAEGGPQVKVREQAPTKKGATGQLLVWDNWGHPGGVAWTNGSLLFMAQSPNALAFGAAFPY